MSGRPNGADAAAEYDVMSAEPMGEDDGDGHDWDANEMSRGAGEDESEPLEADEDDVGGDIEEAIEGEGEEAELADDDDGEDGPDDEDEEGEEEGEEYEEIEPPANWPEEERAWFAELPPALQHAYMSRAQHMLADYTRKTQQIAQQRQQIAQQYQHYQALDQVIQPRTQQWALAGMNPAQAITQLIALSDFATNDAQGFIRYFANLRGVDLQSLVQQQSEEYVDPQVAALRTPLAEVQARLNQLAQQYEQGQQQQQYQQHQAAFNATSAAIDEFARQTGQDGQPLYPFFDDVVDDMAVLIESGRAHSMPEAYRLAVRLNDNVHAKMLARSRADENARARARAQQARRAASSLTGASGANGAFNRGDMNIRDTINAAWSGEI